MRILVQGTDPKPRPEPPWWVDKPMKCENCGTVIELDYGDRPVLETDDKTGIIPKIMICCPICKELITMMRPAATTSVRKYQESRTPLAS